MRNQQKTPLASPIAAEIAMRHRMEEFVPIVFVSIVLVSGGSILISLRTLRLSFAIFAVKGVLLL
jgi:hypothetical protein